MNRLLGCGLLRCSNKQKLKAKLKLVAAEEEKVRVRIGTITRLYGSH